VAEPLPRPDRPCATCPFRVDHDPGTFGIDAYDDLRATVGAPGAEAWIDAPLFACHHSRAGEESVCAGWLAVCGHKHLGVRLAVATGRLEPVEPDDTWPALHPDYDTVVAHAAGPPGACKIPAPPPRPRTRP
jgi:hypothetical protein